MNIERPTSNSVFNRFDWRPAMKTLEEVADAGPASFENTVVALIHVEPADVVQGSSAETKLVKNAKWLARKWEVTSVVLHSFAHFCDARRGPKGKDGRYRQR